MLYYLTDEIYFLSNKNIMEITYTTSTMIGIVFSVRATAIFGRKGRES